MKNFFVSASLFLATLFGANTVMAQAQNCNNNCNNCTTEQCAAAKCTPCNQPCNNECTPCGPQGSRAGVFEGLNLTDQQKDAIKALRKDAGREVSRKDQLAKLKTILTPEQYQQFLENSYVNAGKPESGFHGRAHKFDKRNLRGDRQQKIEKAQKLEKKEKK